MTEPTKILEGGSPCRYVPTQTSRSVTVPTMRFEPSPATIGTMPQPVSLRIFAAQLKGSEGRKVGTSLRMT
jgi:hypothetical protein